MLIIINKSDIDVNMSEQTNAKFEGPDRYDDIARCVNTALADLSLPPLNMLCLNVVREGTSVGERMYSTRVCFDYEHGDSINRNLISLDKISDADTIEANTSLLNDKNVLLKVVFGKENVLEYKGFIYVTAVKEFDVRVTIELGEPLLTVYRDAFVEMIKDIDKCATVMGAGAVATKAIKKDSICVDAKPDHRMYLGLQGSPIGFSECPVFVQYSNGRYYVKHGAFLNHGVYALSLPGQNLVTAYCYAPGYAYMGDDFKYDALIKADNIVELEHALSITSAVNNNIVVNAARGTPSRGNVDWYVEGRVLEHPVIEDRIDTMIAKAIAHSDSEHAAWLGGAPGYDRFYDVLASIIRMANSDNSFTIKSEEIVGFICSALHFDDGDLKVTSMEDFINSDAFKRAIGNAPGLWGNDTSDALIGKIRAILTGLRPGVSDELISDVIDISKAIGELINNGCDCTEIATIFNTVLLDVHNGTATDVIRGAELVCGKENRTRSRYRSIHGDPEQTDKVRAVICDAISDLCIDIDERTSKDVDVLIKICDLIHNDVKDLSIAETMAVAVRAFDGVGSFRNANTEEIAECILHGARRSRYRRSGRLARSVARPPVMHVDRTKIRECIETALIDNGVSPAESNSEMIGRINGSVINIIEKMFDGQNDKPMAKIIACTLLNYVDTAPIALCLYNHRLVEIVDLLVKDAAKTMSDSEVVDFINIDELGVIFNDLRDHVEKLLSRMTRHSKYTW